MRIRIRANKLLLLERVFFFFLSIGITTNVYAEYYMVRSEPSLPVNCCCQQQCSYPCSYTFSYTTHHVFNVIGSGEEEDYEWVGDP